MALRRSGVRFPMAPPSGQYHSSEVFVKISPSFFFIILSCSSLFAHSLCHDVHHVTASDYCDYLNHVAENDPDSFYDEAMSSDPLTAALVREGEPGSYHYSVLAGREDFPITSVSRFNEAGYCDWFQNNFSSHDKALSPGDRQEDDFLASSKNHFIMTKTDSLPVLNLIGSDEKAEGGHWMEDHEKALMAAGAITGALFGAKVYSSCTRASEYNAVSPIQQQPLRRLFMPEGAEATKAAEDSLRWNNRRAEHLYYETPHFRKKDGSKEDANDLTSFDFNKILSFKEVEDCDNQLVSLREKDRKVSQERLEREHTLLFKAANYISDLTDLIEKARSKKGSADLLIAVEAARAERSRCSKIEEQLLTDHIKNLRQHQNKKVSDAEEELKVWQEFNRLNKQEADNRALSRAYFHGNQQLQPKVLKRNTEAVDRAYKNYFDERKEAMTPRSTASSNEGL